jgi:ADP-heptose:LPS heptosyltransferase
MGVCVNGNHASKFGKVTEILTGVGQAVFTLRGSMSTQARILVIRFSSIGDIVLTTPVLRALKTQLHGGAEVHVLTKKKFASLFSGNPNVDRVHSIERTVQEVIPELEAAGFDYIIDLHNNIRSRVVKRKLKVMSFTFKKLNFKKWLWVNLGINKMPDVHVVDRYMDTLAAFSVKDDGEGLDFFIPENEALSAGILPLSHASGYVAIAMGGAHAGKRMTTAQIREICDKISQPVILLGGPEDKEYGDQLAREIPDRVINMAGACSIHGSADVVRIARVVITGDTGMMHIAAAFERKIISVWGCTTPGLGMSPYRPHPDSVIIEPHGRTKRPCSKLGNKCKYGEHNRCIEAVSQDEIVAAVSRLW